MPIALERGWAYTSNMAYFPAVPQYGKDVYGNDVPKRDKHGKHIWSKSVDTDAKPAKSKALKKRLTPKQKVQVRMAEGKLSEKGATKSLVKHYSK